MIALALFSIAFQASGPIEDVLTRGGFEFLRYDRATKLTAYKNAARKSWVFWRVSSVSGPEHARTIFRNIDGASQRPPRAPEAIRPASGIALGLHLRYDPWAGGILLRSASESAAIEVKLMRDRRGNPGGDPSFAAPDLEMEPATVEAVARWLLAKETGKRMTAATVTLSGQSMPALRDGSGRTHVRLGVWAKRRGYAVNANLLQARVSIDTPRGAVLVALGAPAVKVGNPWYPISAVVVADGDEVCVPVEIISLLNL